jgi:YD repeat-containing protein
MADGVMFVTSPDGWWTRARYIKEVDADEKTTRFAQEIYDAAGRLTAMHEKFPVDLGHKQM